MVKLLSIAILLFNVGTVCAASSSLTTGRHARSSDQCNNFVESPFAFCLVAGYNETFKFPDFLTGDMLQGAANTFKNLWQNLKNCSNNTLAVTMGCSYVLPQCSKGNPVYPCKRVCSEFLKQCEQGIPDFLIDYIIASCHVLPDEKALSGKCHEPPNFTANDNVSGE